MFIYSHSNINVLEKALSPERFGGYVRRCGGDRELAVLQYERNTCLSEALYGVLQGLEVALRNSIHDSVATSASPNWYKTLRLYAEQRDMITAAEAKILKRGKLLTAGRVVAELSFGFWTSLVAPRYEKTFWVPHLHKCFPNALATRTDSNGQQKVVKINRQPIFERLDGIRKLRNRIAHHEPIIGLDLPTEYAKIIETVSWMCPTTRSGSNPSVAFGIAFNLSCYSVQAKRA